MEEMRWSQVTDQWNQVNGGTMHGAFTAPATHTVRTSCGSSQDAKGSEASWDNALCTPPSQPVSQRLDSGRDKDGKEVLSMPPADPNPSSAERDVREKETGQDLEAPRLGRRFL